MLVYVLNQREKPLMPCAPPKARALLKQGKAKVVRREPFTIKSNPEVSGVGYQQGSQKNFYNTEAYVLHRHGYECQSGRKCRHDQRLNVHHLVFRSNRGTDAPSNLLTLCAGCHKDLHAGRFQLKARRSKSKHATEIGIVKGALLRSDWEFEPTLGYETKFKREAWLRWEKSHVAGAVAIACDEGEYVEPAFAVYRKRHVAKGDRQQTSGARSERRVPTGKLFGLRKFDKVLSTAGPAFVKGKHSSGYFSISKLDGNDVHNSIKAAACQRLSARTTTLTERTRLLPALNDRVSAA